MRSTRVLAVAAIVVLALGACSTPNTPEAATTPAPSPWPTSPTPAWASPSVGGRTATWKLRHPGSVTAETTTLTLAVTRTACSDGVTGEVQTPTVRYEESQIVIETDVEQLADGTANSSTAPAASTISPAPIPA